MVERVHELEPAARDVGHRLALEAHRRVGVDEIARLVDGVVADDHVAGEDERLRAAARIGEPGVDDALVRALAWRPFLILRVYTSDMKSDCVVAILFGRERMPPGRRSVRAARRPPRDRAAPPARHTPRWAFEPWISKDISDTRRHLRLRRRLRAIATSPSASWCSIARGRPTTTPSSPTRRATATSTSWSATCTRDGVRIVLWITQMVNEQRRSTSRRAATPTTGRRRTSTKG